MLTQTEMMRFPPILLCQYYSIQSLITHMLWVPTLLAFLIHTLGRHLETLKELLPRSLEVSKLFFVLTNHFLKYNSYNCGLRSWVNFSLLGKILQKKLTFLVFIQAKTIN